MSSTQEPTITLYTMQTPNGQKISTLLEELGLPYKVHKINSQENEQKQPPFLAINPNGRIPAITDVHPTDPSKTIRVFESGSVMQYLVSKYDKDYKLSFPPGTPEHIELTNWLFFQTSSHGPIQGQSNHFTRYCPEDIPYARNRFQEETKRVFGVLEDHLAATGGPFIMGEKFTIADLAHWPWISISLWSGVELTAYPHIRAWDERIWARPAVKRGANVPDQYKSRELFKDPAAVAAAAEKGKAWVQEGLKKERERNAEREKGGNL